MLGGWVEGVGQSGDSPSLGLGVSGLEAPLSLFGEGLDEEADGFELFLGVAFEDVLAEGGAVVGVGVAGHFGVGDEAGGVEHPLMIVVGTEALVAEAEVDALDLEGGEGGFFVDGVAGDAGVSGHADELLTEFDLVIGGFFGGGSGCGEPVVLAEAVGHVFGMEGEGGHTHFEPWAGAWGGGAEEHLFEVVGVEHRAHVSEGRTGLDEALVAGGDVVEEGLGLGVDFGEEGGFAVVFVAGGAVKGVDLAMGVGFDGVVLQEREEGGGEGFFFLVGEVEAG